jgi:hypothetical protein
MAHELLHSLKSKQGRGGLMAVKIDIEQAIDRMEWDFFYSFWTNWVFIPPGSHGSESAYEEHHFPSLLMGSPLGC